MQIKLHKLGVIAFALIAIGLFTGCRAFVVRSGDVKIYRDRQVLIHYPVDHYSMKLSPINISKADTNVIKVRNIPMYLAGKFDFSLSMSQSLAQTNPSLGRAWKKTVILIYFQKLDGTVFANKTLKLCDFEKNSASPGRQLKWKIIDCDYVPRTGPGQSKKPISFMDLSYDIIVIVKNPTLRKGDQVFISASAFGSMIRAVASPDNILHQ